MLKKNKAFSVLMLSIITLNMTAPGVYYASEISSELKNEEVTDVISDIDETKSEVTEDIEISEIIESEVSEKEEEVNLTEENSNLTTDVLSEKSDLTEEEVLNNKNDIEKNN